MNNSWNKKSNDIASLITYDLGKYTTIQFNHFNHSFGQRTLTQKVYHIIVPTTGNNGSPEANHYYDHIHQSKQEDHFEKILW